MTFFELLLSILSGIMLWYQISVLNCGKKKLLFIKIPDIWFHNHFEFKAREIFLKRINNVSNILQLVNWQTRISAWENLL